jgi:DNA-3-methyladenine glycosylase II
LGGLNVFPGDDVGARNNLARWLDCQGPLNYGGVRAVVSRWRPFAGLVYFHLLLANLEEHGICPRPEELAAEMGPRPDGGHSVLRRSSG